MELENNVTLISIGSEGTSSLSFHFGFNMGASAEYWEDACLFASLIGVLILSGIGFYFFCNVINRVTKELKRFNKVMVTVAANSRDVKVTQTKMRATQNELKRVFEDKALGLNSAIAMLESASKSLENAALAGAQEARPLPRDRGVTLTQDQAAQPLLPDLGVLRLPPQPYISLTQARMVSPRPQVPDLPQVLGVPQLPQLLPRQVRHPVRHVRFAVPLTHVDEEAHVHLRPGEDCAYYSVIGETTVRPLGGRESREREAVGERAPGYPGACPGPFKAPTNGQGGASGTRI